MAKWQLAELQIGTQMEATFYPNPSTDSDFKWRATHLDGKRAPKVVLCKDKRVRPGRPCLVRLKAITKPDRADHGLIEVEFLRQHTVRLEGVYLDPIISKKLQVLLESGLNILLDGPQGCGKTTLAKTIAEELGMRFVFFNCSAVVEATDFLATIQVRASESGQPVTDFVKTEFLTALEEAQTNPDDTYLIFLDEFNRCQESARNALMPALDSTRRVYNPVASAFLKIPDNVQFIGAVNRGNEFSGTFGIDAAQLDRFAPLQMDYMPPDEEVKLLRKRHPELGEGLVKSIVRLAEKIRASDEVMQGLSVRATEEACIYLKHPLFDSNRRQMLSEILKSSFCGRYGGRWNDPASDAGVVWTLIEAGLTDREQEA